MNKIFFQSYFSVKIMRMTQKLFAIIALTLPCNSALALAPSKRIAEQKQYNAMHAATALGSLKCARSAPSIIGKNEWDELLCIDLVKALNKHVKTSFGAWAMGQMLYPVSDKAVIEQKQNTIRVLVENEKLFNQLDRLLKKVAECEDAYLSYFDQMPWRGEDDPRNKALPKNSSYKKAGAQAHMQSTYFSFNAYRMLKSIQGEENIEVPFADKLNRKTMVMEGSFWWGLGTSTVAMVGYVGLSQVWERMQQYVFTGGACGGNKNWLGLVKEGFYGRIKDLYPFRYKLLDKNGECLYDPHDKSKASLNEQLAQDALGSGTLGDKAYIYANPGTVKVPFPRGNGFKRKFTWDGKKDCPWYGWLCPFLWF